MVILPNSQRLCSSSGCLRRCEQRDSLLVAGILRFKDQFIKTEEMSLRYKWQGCGLNVGKLQKALTGSDFGQGSVISFSACGARSSVFGSAIVPEVSIAPSTVTS